MTVPTTRHAPAPSRDTIAALCLAYATTGDIEKAGRAVGMTLGEAVAALRTMGARQLMARALRHVTDVEAAPEALAVMRAELKSASARQRLEAAKFILSSAGVAARPDQATAERTLAELSADDLAALIAELKAEKLDSAADEAQPVAQPIDFMD